MYHSITIGEKNTWDDWHLIPRSRPLVNPPGVKTNYIEIPGGHGSLDFTTALTGSVLYKNRTGSWEFIVQNGFKDWAELYSEIMNYLHGRSFQAVLEDDPSHYYEGRFAVNAWKSDSYYSTIVIDYNVGPYKRNIMAAGDDWLWDPFDFVEGYIASYENLTVDYSLNVSIVGGKMLAHPVVVSDSDNITVEYGGVSYPLVKGENEMPFTLAEGDNRLVFSGYGTITIIYRGGSL